MGDDITRAAPEQGAVEGLDAERWIESLHEDANGLVWTTIAELRQWEQSIARRYAALPVPASRERCLDCGKLRSEPGVPAICAAWHDG